MLQIGPALCTLYFIVARVNNKETKLVFDNDKLSLNEVGIVTAPPKLFVIQDIATLW